MSQGDVYYADYLQLDKILNAQLPESQKKGIEAHDEMLFIITHQAYELWFKQVLYELDSIRDIFASPQVNDNSPSLQIAEQRLGRINTILHLLIGQIDVLETMTSMDFLDFRDLLRPASGFQSMQWKELEAKLGLRYQDRHGRNYYISQLKPQDATAVKALENESSVLELLGKWLERMPYFDIPELWQQEPWQSPEQFWPRYRDIYLNSLIQIESENAALFDRLLLGVDESPQRRLSARACRAAVFIMLYRGYPLLQLPFKLLMGLLETDELMATWRTRHMNMVFRMIGSRVGTGNSSGRNYLKAALDKHYVFAELAELNGLLVARNSLPALPQALEQRLGFADY